MGRENHEIRASITTDNPAVNFRFKKLDKTGRCYACGEKLMQINNIFICPQCGREWPLNTEKRKEQ
jgi:predicted RNA-binding Zn-ribbon protein involved in translation (DUF1610 family)